MCFIRVAWVLLGGAVVSLPFGCKYKSDARYSVQMTSGDRTVKVSSDKIASITFDNRNFVISLSSMKCIVERERVLYDGREQARIPAAATSIVIDFFEGKLSIIADGQTIREASPPS